MAIPLRSVSKGMEIFWLEINGVNFFWVFFIDKISFFPVLPFCKTAGQASSCSGSVIPVPQQVIHSRLQPFLYAWNIPIEKGLQLRSSNQRMSWMLKLLWGMKRRGMCLFWFRNLLYLHGLPTVLEKFHVLSSFLPDWHRLLGTAGLCCLSVLKQDGEDKEKASSVNELLLGSWAAAVIAIFS